MTLHIMRMPRSHRGPSRTYIAGRGHQAGFRRKLEAMRDLVADLDMSVLEAGHRAGFNTDSSVYRAWATIKQEIGAQAMGSWHIEGTWDERGNRLS